jgi:hypothetical protein
VALARGRNSKQLSKSVACHAEDYSSPDAVVPPRQTSKRCCLTSNCSDAKTLSCEVSQRC